MPSMIGDLRIVERDGAITAVEFGLFAAIDADARNDENPVLVRAVAQLREYFDGHRQSFDLPLAPAGTPFQQSVWRELTRVPYGQTASYGDIARRIGLGSGAARAVGLANRRNPIPIIIPCHRVVGADGTLTGYAGGIARKQALLELEQRFLL